MEKENQMTVPHSKRKICPVMVTITQEMREKLDKFVSHKTKEVGFDVTISSLLRNMMEDFFSKPENQIK